MPNPTDKLVIKYREPGAEADTDTATEIQLQASQEHTGSFTQFHYTSTEALQRKQMEEKKKASANKDNFDEIWSSL